ncbi:MAG: hypothetical protein LBI63_04910 [Candidatus Ancillula sp.]|jgi:hypothetical protein|nr:hypothetical protein [Candidatus Ancillula sp.]
MEHAWLFNLALDILGVVFVIGMDGVMIPKILKGRAQTDPYTWVIFVILCMIGVYFPIKQGLNPVEIVVPIFMLILDAVVMVVAFMKCRTKASKFNKFGIIFAVVLIVVDVSWNAFIGYEILPDDHKLADTIGNFIMLTFGIVAVLSVIMRVRAIVAGNREVPLGIILMGSQYLLVIAALPWISGSGPLPVELFSAGTPLINSEPLDIFFIIAGPMTGFIMNFVTLIPVLYYNKKRDKLSTT